jgi:uncharacterized GH25 family protein
MQTWLPALVVAAALVPAANPAFAAERVAATGKVIDAAGKPVEHAMVWVHQAGVKRGYSVVCPSCYTDCGKHTLTDAEGNFSIGGLAPDLWFTLLVVKDGHRAAYIRRVDPARGPAETTTLKPRPAIGDPAQIVRGRIVDPQGQPLRDAVVEQQGVSFQGPDGRMGMMFGPFDWIDQRALSNEKGEFEMAYGKPVARMVLQVTARGMAPKLFSLPTGAERKTMTVTSGALIRGRLLYQGKPVAGAEVGLTAHSRSSGTTYAEVRIGTREDGTFAITNVPPGRIWLLYPKMGALAERGIGAREVVCETKDDGEDVDLGDIQLKPAHTLRGKVVLADGKPVLPEMLVTLSADRAGDSQVAPIGADGRFEFRGLPSGVYSLTPAVRGYRLADGPLVEALVNRDIDTFIIRMEVDSRRR